MKLKDVEILALRDDGKQFIADGTATGEASWGITELAGIGGTELENFVQPKASGDGDFWNGNRIKSRVVEFAAKAKNPALNDVLRRAAVSFWHPRHKYKLYVTYQGITRWIECVIEAKDIPSIAEREQQEVRMALLCPQPFFRSVDEFGLDIAGVDPLWSGEEIYDSEWGAPFGAYLFATTVDITNDGDVEAYATAIIRASGPVVNPKISKGDSYIRVLDNLALGDVLEIDIERRKVLKNGENIIAKIDRTSDFAAMGFDVGTNYISYGADSGETAMSVTVYYNKLYLGV